MAAGEQGGGGEAHKLTNEPQVGAATAPPSTAPREGSALNAEAKWNSIQETKPGKPVLGCHQVTSLDIRQTLRNVPFMALNLNCWSLN